MTTVGLAVVGGVAGAAVLPLATRFNLGIPMSILPGWNPFQLTALAVGLAALVGGWYLYYKKRKSDLGQALMVLGGVSAARAAMDVYLAPAPQAIRRTY